MSLNPWQEAILDRLSNGVGTTPGFGADQVFAESVPEQARLGRMGDLRSKVYICVWFGQRIDVGPTHNGICGTRDNAHLANFLVQVNGPDGNTVRRGRNLVSDLLWGFKPASQGELKETSTTTIRRPLDISGVEARNTVPIAYSGTVDI